MQYDVVIVGAGIAGLYTALNIPKSKKVLIINKAEPWECNTYYAQGGVSTAYDESDIASHVEDTMDAGAGLCKEDAVQVLSDNSIAVIEDLIARGFEFDKDEDGKLLYTKEAAHSTNRILHAGGDATGRYLHYFLLSQNPHPLMSNATMVDLLMEDNIACGVVVEYRGERREILAKNVVIASGGVGSLFEYHTNAYSISGDIHGICIEKDIEMENMEMLQFHPTVFVENNAVQKQLLTEALRGEGAKVVDENGYSFLKEYDQRAELAPRDIVSRAIFDYAQKKGKKVYLSFETFSEKYFEKRFPNITKNLRLLGYDVPTKKVPISPAFHYSIGGIKTDIDARISGVDSLYAVGEVASTGVHGANRLASNSLLEGLVFAIRAAKSISYNSVICEKTKFRYNTDVLEKDSDKAKKDILRRIMWDNVSISRTFKGLQSALESINELISPDNGRLLSLRLLTAKSIVKAALKRKTSLGVHFINEDEK